MLKESSIRKIKTLLGQNLQNQDGYFNKLQWTKKLTIRDDRNDKLEQQGFITLISYSPKLQEIDLRGTAFNNTCTAYLRNVDSTIYLKNIEIIMCPLQLFIISARHLRVLHSTALIASQL